MASSLVSESLTLATAHLQALYTSLPPSLQAYLESAYQLVQPNPPHPSTQGALDKATALLARADFSTLAAIILPLLALIFFMSQSIWHGGSGGRHSPFTNRVGSIPPIEPEDYEYIIDKTPLRRGHDSYGLPPPTTSHRHTEDLAPDILVMKHKGATYPLHFPAFDIAEGHLKVGELRRLAAKVLGVEDPRRIKLLYKGKSLRDDRAACKEEGLKQNSEILCVVSSDPYARDDGDESSSSASSEMIANGFDPGPRAEVDGTISLGHESRKRKGRGGGRKRKPRDSERASPRDSPRDSGFLVNTQRTVPSASRQPSPVRRGPSPAPPTPQPQPPRKPNTPAEVLEQISDNFNTQFLPQVRAFMAHPPAEAKTRDFEYKKLSEAILTQVIMKLDEVETEGNEALRAKRKELVKETQAYLTDLDRIGKR